MVELNKENLARANKIIGKFRQQLEPTDEKSLKNALDRLQTTFSSDFFKSLVDINDYFKASLTDVNSETRQLNIPDMYSAINNDILSNSYVNQPRGNAHIAQNESDYIYNEITISRDPGSNQSFGFSIAGGIDAPNETGDPDIYVYKIFPGGIADRNGQLRVNDKIHSVNGTSLMGVRNLEAVRTLKESGDTLILVVRRDLPDSASQSIREAEKLDSVVDNDFHWYQVRLEKPIPGTSLGFSIAGGRDITNPEGQSGIFITKISPNGLADKSGNLFPGDQLMKVNGVDLSAATHTEAVQTLKNTGNIVDLLICRFTYDSEVDSYANGDLADIPR